eukprot:TRINITY_DN8817_c0_g1_i3.p1 TRINITY_DN8817_c0_g1~~TRINITY_DN8817_c0_g1_i3.p1  ORF type:complete len:181 (+),score=7.42 TRINITY_DN8817_c0_g1_i3:24-566(+)
MEGSEDRNDPEAKEMITFEDIPSDDPKQNTKDRTHPLNDDQCKKINTYIDYRGLSDDDPQVRINKLNEIDDPKYDEEVIFLLLNDEDEEVRKTASKKLVVGASEERVYLLFKVAHESELVVDTLEEILDVEGQGRTRTSLFCRMQMRIFLLLLKGKRMSKLRSKLDSFSLRLRITRSTRK